MNQKRTIRLIILIVAIGLLACRNSSELASLFESPLPPTPTFVVAHFSTATVTPTLTDTPAVALTEPLTPTAALMETPEPPAVDTDQETETPAAEYEAAEPTVEPPSATPPPTATPNLTPSATSPPPPPTPTDTPIPTPPPPSGRIAFPIDDGAGHYDVWVLDVAAGEAFIVQPRARQPDFSKDGKLIVNLQDSDLGEHIGWLDANFAWKGEVSDSPYDSHPTWRPDGNLYAFSNPQMLEDPHTGAPLPHIFIPCSMERPFMENEARCRDIGTGGKVSTGEYPVWTDDDRLAFFYFAAEDGIYVVSGASNLWQAGGVGQPQLLVTGNGRPTDTQGFQVYFFASDIDQNWEAYQIDLDGSNLINLSNSPTSLDGLPTVSPDGNWVAFMSDRDGHWGIWLVPRGGGEPTKLFDLFSINTNPSPWGTDDRDWTLERMSWGP
jgi:hypothetical protein